MKRILLLISCFSLFGYADINKSVSIISGTNKIITSVTIDENSTFSGNHGVIINNTQKDINLSNMIIQTNTHVKNHGIFIGNTGIIIGK